ncbi:hypothetical protein XarbCFBP8150_21530, partial [Xanthomonas arboricola]
MRQPRGQRRAEQHHGEGEQRHQLAGRGDGNFHVACKAGQLVTLFAFTVMLFGPPLTAWLSHLDRK